MKHIINDYFDNIFVIAHPYSSRYKTFNESWVGLKYNLERFVSQDTDCYKKDNKAIHSLEELPNNLSLYDPLSKGQIACALAHMLIYKKIINQKLYHCLILEDDSVFNSVSNLNVALESDYDILALFTANCDLHISPSDAAPYTDKYSRAGTSAYVIKSPEVAENLYNSQIKSLNTADGVIMRSDMKVYAVYPPVCSCDNSPSIIVNGLY